MRRETTNSIRVHRTRDEAGNGGSHALRRLLLSTTAAAALGLAVLGGSAEDALAACTLPADTVLSVGNATTGSISVAGTALQITGNNGTANVNHDIDSTGTCAIYIDATSANINIANVTVSGVTDETIFIASGATGNTITLNGTTVTSTTVAIQDNGTNATTVVLNTGTSVSGDINLGNGTDTFTYNGGTVTGTVNLGAGMDVANIALVNWTSSFVVDGGGDDDILSVDTTGGPFSFTNGDFTNTDFLNFENLVVTGNNSLSIQSDVGGDSFVNVTVSDAATLDLNGTWTVTGNLVVENGASVETSGASTTVGGVLRVESGGTFTANVGFNLDSGTIQVDAGGVFVSNATITGSSGSDAIIVDGSFTTNNINAFSLGLGDDTITVSGTFNVTMTAGNVIGLSDGDDTVTFNSTGSLSITLPGINAGAGNQPNGDRLIFDGTAGNDFDLSGLETFTNFEHLIKQGSVNWTLRADTVTGAFFETLAISGGGLALVGNWTFSGNISGTALNIGGGGAGLLVGDGVNPTNLMQTDATGTVNVFSNLIVNNMATATFAGATTVFTGGMVTVNDGGELHMADLTVQLGGNFTVNNGGIVTALAVDFQDQSVASIAGMMDATTTNIAGNVTIQSTGDYEATGAVTLVGAGLLTVSGGAFTGGSTVDLSGTSRIVMTTGTFTVQGALTAGDGSSIRIEGGTFNANNSTTLSGTSQLQVLGGNYVAAGFILLQDNAQMRVDDQFVPNGTVFASSSTQIDNNASLVVSGGAYNATGGITLNNNGILRVDDNGTVSAMSTTDINDTASLIVLDSGVYHAAGTITLFGGSVVGNGSITGNQLMDNQAGTISPGLGVGDAGTLTFQGTYQAGAGANFIADIQPGGPADLFAISNTATLAGNVNVNTIAPGFAGVEQFRIISTSAPITGIFDTATLSGVGSGSLIVWVGRVDNAGSPTMAGNNVDVLLAPGFGTLTGLTPNQQAVADYLNAGVPGGTIVIEDPFVFILIQIVGAGPNALDQIGGEVYDSFTTFSFDIARQYGGLVDQRVRTLRCAAAPGPAGAFCGPGTTLFASDRQPNVISSQQLADAGPGLAPGAPGAVAPRGFSPNTHPYGWSVWAAGLGSYLSKDRTSTNLGYSGWTGGGVIGVDLALSERWIVGVMVGGTKSDINFSGVSGSGDLEAVTFGLYTAWYGSRWFADAAFTYTKTWVEANRDLTFLTPTLTANGKTEGDQYAAHATVGYGFKIRRVSLELAGGLDYVRLRQDSFTETGAGFLNLSVQSRTDDSLRLRFGVRIATAWKLRPNLILAPNLRVGYARELLDNTRPITSSLAPIGGSFTVHGDDGGRNILTFGGGLQATFSQGITLFAAYSGEWAGDLSSHGFTGGIKVSW